MLSAGLLVVRSCSSSLKQNTSLLGLVAHVAPIQALPAYWLDESHLSFRCSQPYWHDVTRTRSYLYNLDAIDDYLILCRLNSLSHFDQLRLAHLVSKVPCSTRKQCCMNRPPGKQNSKIKSATALSLGPTMESGDLSKSTTQTLSTPRFSFTPMNARENRDSTPTMNRHMMIAVGN